MADVILYQSDQFNSLIYLTFRLKLDHGICMIFLRCCGVEQSGSSSGS